jgi:Ring finger domain
MTSSKWICVELKLLLLRLAEVIPDGPASQPETQADVLRRVHSELKSGVHGLQQSLHGMSLVPSNNPHSTGQVTRNCPEIRRDLSKQRAMIIFAFCQAVRIFGRDLESEKLVLQHRFQNYLKLSDEIQSTGTLAQETLHNLGVDFDRCIQALDQLEHSRENEQVSTSTPLCRSLDPLEIDRLLPSVLESSTSLDNCSRQCIICLQQYVPWEEVRIFAPCRHKFHKVCIDLWLTSWTYGPTCPVCRVHLHGAQD